MSPGPKTPMCLPKQAAQFGGKMRASAFRNVARIPVSKMFWYILREPGTIYRSMVSFTLWFFKIWAAASRSVSLELVQDPRKALVISVSTSVMGLPFNGECGTATKGVRSSTVKLMWSV